MTTETKPYERELKRTDGTVYAVERDHKLCCGHIVRGVPVKIPYHRATGLYCYECNGWVGLLANWDTQTPNLKYHPRYSTE